MLELRRLAPLLVGLGLSASLFAACAESDSDKGENNGAAGATGTGGAPAVMPRRVVGYLPTYRSLAPESYDFDTLTHLCIAFANPTGNGAESDFDANVRESIAPLVTAAHEKGVKVLASIAGGTKASGELVGAQLTPDKVDAYIAALLDLVDRYELDGIDVDIEGEAVTATYEPFVKKLNAALPEGKLLTAAVATKNRDAFTDGALAEYDFINVMSYDQCSWSDLPCEQATLEATNADLEYWTVERSVPRDKTVLGVPFYGWCWGCSDMQSALTYGQILAQYPQAKTEDWIVEGEQTISLNSAATIATKAELAQEYGGVMIWELGQDAPGDDALFKVIADAQ
jgi:GH18 family chitinase